jgi:hypothetical protein
MRQIGVLGLLFLGLAGCVSEPVLTPPPIDMTENCGAEALQNLVGKPKSVLDTMTFAQPVRVIGPGMAVTMDYNPQRLNINYDKKDIIISLTCG